MRRNPKVSANDAMPNAFRIPFRDITRKKGQWTVVLSLISIAMVHGGFWPEKITAFGFGFGTVNHSALCWILIIAIVYCFYGFAVYAVYDSIENRAEFHLEQEEKARKKALEPSPAPGKPILVPSDAQYYQAKRFHNPIHKRIYGLGMLHDCGMPLILSVWAIVVLLNHIFRK
jgi:hypothetical protein